MTKKLIETGLVVLVFLLMIFTAINFVSAGVLKIDLEKKINDSAKNVGGEAGYEEVSGDYMLNLVQTVINAFLSIIGVLLLVYLLYAGYNWMTAQGEEEKVTKAKETIQRAIMGLIIIVAGYAISTFVMSRLEKGTLKEISAGRTVAVNYINE